MMFIGGRRFMAGGLLFLVACGPLEVSVTEHPAAVESAAKKIVFFAGPDSHGPKAHEHQAGSELLAAALRARNPAVATANIYGGWPDTGAVFEDMDALVIYCDGGKGHLDQSSSSDLYRLGELRALAW